MIDLCYAKAALTYREQMAGNSAATELPRPSGSTGSAQWQTVVNELTGIGRGITEAMKDAKAAHKGKAAEAAQVSVQQVSDRVKASEDTAKGVQKAIEQQERDQHDAFRQLPAEGGKLQTGSPVQMHPPEKDWVDHTFGSWTPLGDYEEKQRYFQETNAEADQVMQQYQNKTEARIAALPKFEPPPPPQQPPPPPPPGDQTAARSLGNSTYSSTPEMGSGQSSSPSSTSSAWSSGSTGGGSYSPSAPSPSVSGSLGPAGTGAAWSSGGGNGALPPGMVKGPDGTVYRQLPDGSWQRQNPYNGRWAPAPQGPPGAAGSGRGGAGGAAGPRGGAGGATGGGRPGGGFGPQGGAPGTAPLSGGGRSGVAPVNGGPSNAAPTSSSTGSGQSGRSGAMRPMGGAGGQQGQGGEEDEHERPSWLVETEDVFTNDMDKTAPPVIGLAPWEKEG